MTIRTQKLYDQHAHDQPTQASEWAAEHGGGGMGADTRKLMAGAASGERPWHESYNAGAARRGPGSDSTIDRRLPAPTPPGVSVHGTIVAPPGSAAYDHMISTRQPGPPGGGALRPQRLTGEQMDAISPGWTDRAYERAQRPDGGNG